jgi:uncharacterized membrane protein required for colicin V production
MNLVDTLFFITIALLVLNGLFKGLVISLIGLLSLPLAFVVAWLFGPHLVQILASAHLTTNPMIAYIVLFLGTVLVLHIVALTFRGIKKIPGIGLADTLGGGVIGFVEAWLLWVVLLTVLQNFLQDTSQVQQLGIDAPLFHTWQDFYNMAVSNSLFAKVNGFFIHQISLIRTPK